MVSLLGSPVTSFCLSACFKALGMCGIGLLLCGVRVHNTKVFDEGDEGERPTNATEVDPRAPEETTNAEARVPTDQRSSPPC